MLTAVYDGNAEYTTSTSQTLTETVNPPATPYTPKVYVSSSLNPAFTGQTVTFTVYVSPSGVNPALLGGTVTLYDGKAMIGSSPLTNLQATFPISTLAAGTHTLTASYGGNANFAAASGSFTETINTAVLGSVVGSGTTHGGQDSFNVNVQSALTSNAIADTGSLTFSDAKAGDTFTATRITSIQINQAPLAGGAATTNGYFTISGYATLNGGTTLYAFTASGSLPFPANPGSTGGLEFTAVGPSGNSFSYSTPWYPWDKGETILITITSP